MKKFKVEGGEMLMQVDGVTVDSVGVTGKETRPQLRLAFFQNDAVITAMGDRMMKDIVIVPGKLVNVITEFQSTRSRRARPAGAYKLGRE